MGCYIGGYNYEFLTSSLTLTMITSSIYSLSYTTTANGKYLVKSKTMSIGDCVSFCLSNGFFLAGLETKL